jgi:UDP-GlcNAc3NAcA epimerase
VIKAGAVSRALARSELLEEVILHTGQHYDRAMSEDFFDELALPAPARNLGVGSGPHGAQTGRMLEAIEAYLAESRPALVLTYGDTNSTLAAALGAAKLGIPVAHVEAGVRSHDITMPEEINRVLTDRLARLLLAPTESAVTNLLREGASPESIVLVGDPLLDVALACRDAAEAQSLVLDSLELRERGYVLATIHRQENTDAGGRLSAIFEGLVASSAEARIVLPLHPRTRAALRRAGLLERVEAALTVTGPLGLLDMTKLERSARLIVTDSGGVQREAFYARVPCLVLRSTSEWPELVALGWSRLVAPRSAEELRHALLRALSDDPPPDTGACPLGDGDAARRIVAALERFARTRPGAADGSTR